VEKVSVPVDTFYKKMIEPPQVYSSGRSAVILLAERLPLSVPFSRRVWLCQD